MVQDIFFRAYYALPPLTRKSDGLPTGAVSGFFVVCCSNF
jgi:5'-3' exonuclease